MSPLGTAGASAQVKPVQLTADQIIAQRCKAISFARHPPGQMSTTMRELQIDRCIKNGGSFLE
jgi:hypothetical protein